MAVTTAEKAPWQAEGAEKREAVRAMFAKVAPHYDRVNSLMSLAMHRRWRARAVKLLGLRIGERALDVCCGTGDFLVPLSRAVGSAGLAVGIDYCPQMLALARSKLPGSRLALGDACALPVSSSSFDAVTVGWGLRNLADLDAGIAEMVRALKPGGRFASLDMARPRNRIVRAVSGWVCGALLPWIGSLFGSREAYTYLPKSTERFASREELTEAFERAGLIEVRWKDLMFGNICIHWGRKP